MINVNGNADNQHNVPESNPVNQQQKEMQMTSNDNATTMSADAQQVERNEPVSSPEISSSPQVMAEGNIPASNGGDVSTSDTSAAASTPKKRMTKSQKITSLKEMLDQNMSERKIRELTKWSREQLGEIFLLLTQKYKKAYPLKLQPNMIENWYGGNGLHLSQDKLESLDSNGNFQDGYKIIFREFTKGILITTREATAEEKKARDEKQQAKKDEKASRTEKKNIVNIDKSQSTPIEGVDINGEALDASELAQITAIENNAATPEENNQITKKE